MFGSEPLLGKSQLFAKVTNYPLLWKRKSGTLRIILVSFWKGLTKKIEPRAFHMASLSYTFNSKNFSDTCLQLHFSADPSEC